MIHNNKPTYDKIKQQVAPNQAIMDKIKRFAYLDEDSLDSVDLAEVYGHVGEGLLLATPAGHCIQP